MSSELKCPHCGNADLEQIGYVEDVSHYHNVVSVSKNEIDISADYDCGDSSEIEFLCWECCERFDTPDGMVITMKNGLQRREVTDETA